MVISKIFNSTAEITKPTGSPHNEANADIETQKPTVEKKKRRCLE